MLNEPERSRRPTMLWITRAGGNVDRVACPWLIKRYIDKEAQFLYVPAEKVLETAALLGARSYDAKGGEFTHQQLAEGEICLFVTLMRSFGVWGQARALGMTDTIVINAAQSAATTTIEMT